MKYIDTPELLAEILPRIAASPWVAVDTEADSLHHYLEKLCLLQLSIPQEDIVIDPLVPLDLSALITLLNEKSLIMHGADFDIRILKRFYNFAPKKVFDTMIAAQLLGYDKQSLADLAKKHCEVNLSKTNQTADWSERPLEESKILYAANDTHYLRHIADVMTEELKALGRLQWQLEFCERLVKSILAKKEEKVASGLEWQVKGSKDLNPKALTILKELWIWRESQARLKDKPPFKILHSEMLLKIAQWTSEHTPCDVANLPLAPRNLKSEYRDALNEVVAKAKLLPPTRFTTKPFKIAANKWTNASEVLFKALKEEREKIAKELKIQPSLLATNVVLESIVVNSPKSCEEMVKQDLLMPWQAEVLGENFLKICYNPKP